jgi:mevalonate kinase
VDTAEARAPGKVILLGEHAVVYGHPAICLPLDRGVTVRVQRAAELRLAAVPSSGGEPLRTALGGVADSLGVKAEVSIDSAIPVGAGLGSSAAVAVAATRALAALAGRALDAAQTLALAGSMEQTFHGKPSGVDHTTCLLATPIRFEAGRASPLRVPRLSLLVVLAEPRAASTREKVLGLRDEHQRDPRRLDALFRDIGALAEPGVRALERGDVRELGRLLSADQELLRAVGVSTDGLDTLCARLLQLGAFGAKLTGAGGGGAVVALHEEPERVAAQLASDGRHAFVSTWAGA